MLLKNKVAIITGGSSGIGKATANLFAEQGAKIVIGDIDEKGGIATTADINNNSGNAIFVKTDVSKMSEVKTLVHKTIETFGKIDVLHSNAAINPKVNALETTEEIWDETLDIGLKATWMLAYNSIPFMTKQGSGVIVITGSVHSIRGYAYNTPYQAAKGGVLALTRSLAADCAPIIRVNVILPGAIETPLWGKLGITSEQAKKSANRCALKRNGQPEEVAQAALFLASDMSSYMTGSEIIVDGGLTSIIQQ
jgi:NAD(P)-dependent dehydrogenase (short-subunit alcohol dehydrogenase family)